MTLSDEAVRAIAKACTEAWNSGSAEAVAAFYAEDGAIVINRVPDLSLVCDGTRVAGDHVAFLWTFTGTHSATGHALRVAGWEEWDLNVEGKVKASRGWFDAEDYARQTAAS